MSSTQKNLLCDTCDKLFTNKTGLKNHILKMHKDVGGRSVCSSYGDTFGSTYAHWNVLNTSILSKVIPNRTEV